LLSQAQPLSLLLSLQHHAFALPECGPELIFSRGSHRSQRLNRVTLSPVNLSNRQQDQ
jgi:hypothetical protein